MAVVKYTITGEDQTGPATKSAVNGISSACDQVKSAFTALKTAVVALGIWKVINEGIKAVDDFQQSVIKTAAMITSLQGGDNVAENYRKAKEYAEGLQVVFQKIDANTSLNQTNLQQINEEMVKQGVIFDYNNKAQIEGFTRLANAVAVYSQNGSQEVQVRQEVRALMMGEVDANSQLSSLLQKTVDGPLKEKVKQWKESGTLVEEIGKRLSGFGPASQDIGSTWSAIKSTMETIVNTVLRAGFQPIVQDIVANGSKLGDYLKEHADLIGNRIKQGWLAVKGVIEGIGNFLMEFKEPLGLILTLTGSILKWWGLLLTAVFPPLMERVGALGRAIWENVKMFGNLASMVWAGLKGDFAGAMSFFDAAKGNWMAGGKAVGDAFATGFSDEVSKRANQFLSLDQVNKRAGGSVAVPKVVPQPDLKELTKQFQDRAKEIVEIEKNRIKELIGLEKGYLEQMKSSYQSQVEELNKFKDAMAGVYKSWEERDKAKADAARGPEEPLVRRARLESELAEEERKINESWADPAEKVKRLNDLIPKYRDLFTELKAGEDVIISQAEANRNFDIAETRIKDTITSVADEMERKEQAVIDTAQAIVNAEDKIKSYNQQLQTLDTILKQLPHTKDINVNIKVNGMDDLARATGFQDFGDYYTLGGRTYWRTGELADDGTGYTIPGAATGGHVERGGLVRVHDDEDIVPAKIDRSANVGGGSFTFSGPMQLVFPNVTNQTTAKELAREVWPELQKLAGLRR
jgi:hypothetical protein